MKIHQVYLVAFVLMVGTFADIMVSNDYCTQEPKTPGDKPKPSLGYSYSALISMKLMENNQISYMNEHSDAINKRSAYSIGTGPSYLYWEMTDFKNRVMTYMQRGACTQHKGKAFDKAVKDAKALGAEIMWQLPGPWKYKNKKQKTIRGMEVDCWTTCVTWPHYANLTASIFYSVNDKIPVRLELKGKSFYKGEITDMHWLHDYFMFTKAQPSPDVFMPPPGIVCNNSQVKTPPLPSSASYRQDDIDFNGKTVKSSHLYFDKVLGYSKETDQNGNVIILDIPRALRYTINRISRTCKRSAFHHLNLQYTTDKVGKVDVVHMASLKHFFLDEGTFTKNGKYKARGIMSDVYSRKSRLAEMVGGSLVEIYVAQPNKTIRYSGLTDSQRAIIRVAIKGSHMMMPLIDEPPTHKVMEIYDFVANPTAAVHHSDIDLCFNGYTRIDFDLKFDGKVNVTSDDHTGKFQKDVIIGITEALNIPYLRVNIRNAWYDEMVAVYGTLYGNEKPMTTFTIKPYRKDNSTRAGYTYASRKNSAVICAEYCRDVNNRPFSSKSTCTSFQYNRMSKDCTFFFTYSSKPLIESGYIDYYDSSYTPKVDYVSLESAWGKFESAVKKGLITVMDSNGNTVKAVGLRRIKAIEKNIGHTDSPRNEFYYWYGKQIDKRPVQTFHKMNSYACARQCLNSLAYYCEGFSVSMMKDCNLYDSDKAVNMKPTKGDLFSSYLYLRRQLSNFDKMPGSTSLITTGATYAKVSSARLCAKMCMRYTAFRCESFEICNGACVLGPTHYFDMPNSKPNTDGNSKCRLFSRKYIEDYMITSNTKELTSNVVVIKNIGVKHCATMCSTSRKYNCHAFQFCATSALCLISTKALANSGVNQGGSCDLYRAKHTLTHSFTSAYSSTSSQGYSPGEMGGMAIGMIILGIIWILVIAMVGKRLRQLKGSHDIATVTFSRMAE